MTYKECIDECEQLIENGADCVEVFEFIEDNTDLDPALIFEKLYY